MIPHILLLRSARFYLVVLAASAPLGNAFAGGDAAGCKDHPLFNRMPNTYIDTCKDIQFDVRTFSREMPDANEKRAPAEVEGPTQEISYRLDAGAADLSSLQIIRNFETAAKKVGGTIEGRPPYELTMKFVKDGKETWASVHAESSSWYSLTIVERQEMQQDIVANNLLDEINKHGFVALYLNFDTGKATLQADAAPQLDQIAQMLKASPLKLEIAGHTDSVGKPEDNQKLSEARAQTVRQELLKRGATADRLTAKGYGPSSPLADNRTEEGRAKNRRVELVKK